MHYIFEEIEFEFDQISTGSGGAAVTISPPYMTV